MEIRKVKVTILVPQEVELTAAESVLLRDLWHQGRKVAAIRFVRDQYGHGLLHSKLIVEANAKGGAFYG